jgi:Mce-associated membrane protein
VEDQPADSGDLTTDAARPDDVTATRRRWGLLRWRSKTSESEPVPAEVESRAEELTESVPESDEPVAPPRIPVGKARRTAKPEPATVETSAETEADDQTSEAVEPDSEETILVPHRPAGKRLLIAAIAAGVLFVGAAAFAGATVQPYLAERALVDTKLDIARTAANAITTLWTYTPDDMETLPDRSARYLGGDLATEYRKYIDAIVAPNKQAQVTNTTQVMGAAVESVTSSEATALVYTNSVAMSPVTKNIPSLRYLSYRLTMQRHDAKWLITRMSTVTSFDLTPQL